MDGMGYGKKAGKTHVSFEFSPQELERQSAELQQLRRAGSKEETRKNRYIPNAAQNQTRGGLFVGFQVSNLVFFVFLFVILLGKWWALDLGTCWGFYRFYSG